MDIVKPVNGEIFDVETLNDNIFAKKLLGDCIAFKSNDGKVYAPIDGTIIMTYPTSHALAIKNEDIKLLIHIGINSATLNGKGFITFAELNKKVKKGDLLVEFNKKVLYENNINDSVMLTLTSSHKFIVDDTIQIVSK